MEFIKKTPIKLSRDIEERSDGYIEIMHFGITYYIPITNEMKKLFKFKRIKDNIIFDSYKEQRLVDKFLSDVIASVYIQIRDTVGNEIKVDTMNKIEEGFSKLFVNKMSGIIDEKLNDKLPLIENKGNKND